MYSFQVPTGSGGIAYVIPKGSGTQLRVFYGTLAELQAEGAHACAGGTGALKTVNGSVANIGSASNVALSLGDAFVYKSGAGSFQFTDVTPGPLDLIGATLDNSGATTQLLRMLLRRNQTIADNGSVGTLDFAGAESFAPATATLTLQNTLGQIVALSEFYHTPRNDYSPFFFEASSSRATSRTIYGVPSALWQVGDVLWVSADALTGSGATTEFRTVARSFLTPLDWTLSLGPALETPQVTALAATPYPRLRASFAWQQEYSRFWEVNFVQSAGARRETLIQVTVRYRGTGSPVVLDIPDLSGVVGWSNTYGLAPGVPASWMVSAAWWNGAVGTTFAPTDDSNNTYYSATKQGTITITP